MICDYCICDLFVICILYEIERTYIYYLYAMSQERYDVKVCSSVDLLLIMY